MPDETPRIRGSLRRVYRRRIAKVRRRTGRHPGPGETATRMLSRPRLGGRKRTSSSPFVCGRRVRGAGWSRARRREARRTVTVTQRRTTVSVTLPRFATSSSSRRDLTRTRNVSRRRTMRPGTRTTTTSPRRIRTDNDAVRSGRVVRRTSSEWSPGSARTGGVEATTRVAWRAGAMASRRGRTLIQERRRRRIRGRPRRSSPYPALTTWRTTASLPVLVTVTTWRAAPVSDAWAGETTSETGGRVTLAPVEAGARRQTAVTKQRITARSACT